MKVWESVPAEPRTTRVGLLEKELQTPDLLSPAEAEQMPVKVWLDGRLDSGAEWKWLLLLLFARFDPVSWEFSPLTLPTETHERLFAPCFHFHSCISSLRPLLLSMFSFLCRQKQCH